jgi:hypothetical protein
MPLFKINEKIILFIHVPKAGGTTIEQYYGALGETALFSRRSLEPCPPQHWDAAILSDVIPRNFYDYAFLIVRHPYDRALSEYRYRCDLQHVDPKRVGFSYWFSAAVRKFRSNHYSMQNHIRPQSDFILEGANVFKFEDGIPNIISRVNGNINIKAEDCNLHSKASKKITVCLKENDLKLISHFYRKDFEVFGYDDDMDAFYERNSEYAVKGGGPSTASAIRTEMRRAARKRVKRVKRMIKTASLSVSQREDS